MLTVVVTDNGVGLTSDKGERTSLGLEIVRTLVTEDLKGTFTFDPGDGGTQATIHLPRPGS